MPNTSLSFDMDFKKRIKKKIMTKKITFIIIGLLVSFVTIQAQTWTQTGADIDGEAEDDRSGQSVSLSSDGSILAVGAWGNDENGSCSGHVRIFQNTTGTWAQVGADIDGEAADDNSGWALSLSSDGSVVAIGAWGNDGNGDRSGHVRIYKNYGGTWIQIWEDIDGEAAGDYSGRSVSLNHDGSVVAVGADGNSGNGTDAGHVRIFKDYGGTWTQIGTDIDGEAAGDNSGRSVSLSSDGSVVAIGAYGNDGNGALAGHVRIYQNNEGTWIKVGADIDGETAYDYLGMSVSLNSDGSIVAVGADGNDDNGDLSGHVKIYQNISGIWTQIGANINGEAEEDRSGGSVSLSADGSVVAVGADENDGNGSKSGHVRIYKNNEGTWTQVGTDIDGEDVNDLSATSVSLSSDGSVVAIGAYGNDGNGELAGHVRVYNFPMPTITSQPANQTDICSGAEIIFSITGENINTYKWQVSTNGGGNWSDLSDNTTYSGVTTNTLTITTDIGLDNYQYHCYVTNDIGNATSDAATLSFETESPTVTCVGNQEVDADATHTYTVTGTEFDPTDTNDNCGVASVTNDFTGTATLTGASLPEGTTTIVWTITDTAGNDADCSFDILVNAYVSIETLQQNGISIFPNPTSGKINFEFANNNIQQITISDLTGKTIIKKTEIQQNKAIDLSQFESGIYIISIQTDKDVFTTKIVKE